jgi:aryl-alcohol dehydrogenase-like predicted oxidoreductase
MLFKFGGSCEYAVVKASLAASLQRLGLSTVDCCYCRRVPSKEAGVAFAVAKQLQTEGLVRSV